MKDATINRRVLSQKINRVMNTIVRIQQAWRSAVVCKRARMKIIVHMWDADEDLWVKNRVQNGDHLRRSSVDAGGQEPAVTAEESWRLSSERDDKREDKRGDKGDDKRSDATGTSGKACTSGLSKRWKALESKFKELGVNEQPASEKFLVVPTKVKIQFARNFVEAARKAHLKAVKAVLKEEVSRLRLRVQYTMEDARQLLKGEEGERGVVLDRLKMQLALQNMSSSSALNTYKHMKDEQYREERQKVDNAIQGDRKMPFTPCRLPIATFAFYQPLRTVAHRDSIRAAVRAAHAAI
jgi:hypothetical protein